MDDLFQNIFKLAAIVALFVLGFGVIGAGMGWGSRDYINTVSGFLFCGVTKLQLMFQRQVG